MDPHFARLLSSLTLSATSMNGTDNDRVKQSTTNTPTVVTQEPMSPSTRARNRHFTRTHSARKASLDVRLMSPLAEVKHSPVAADIKSSQPSASSTTHSPRATSRRTSSTADISPYLSRPLDLPTSAKQLKQMALLESVADESAKLATTTMHHNSTLSATTDASYAAPVSPLPVSSNTPHMLYNHSLALLHQRSPLLGAPATTKVPSYSLPVRSITSHALYRDPIQTFSPNLNIQSHSLDVMGASSNILEPLLRSHGHTHAAASTASIVNPSQMQSGPLSPPSRQFARLTPTPSGIPPHNASANSLLSILNSRTQGHATGPFWHWSGHADLAVAFCQSSITRLSFALATFSCDICSNNFAYNSRRYASRLLIE